MSPGSVPASEHIPTDILICRPPRFLLAGQVRRCRGCRRPVPAEFPRSPSDPEVGSYRVPASPSSRPAVRRVEGDGLFRTATAWRPPDPGADKGRILWRQRCGRVPLGEGDEVRLCKLDLLPPRHLRAPITHGRGVRARTSGHIRLGPARRTSPVPPLGRLRSGQHLPHRGPARGGCQMGEVSPRSHPLFFR